MQPERLAIVRLPAESSIPAWAGESAFLSVTRTDEELSVVCRDDAAPPEVMADRGWRCLKVLGPFDLQNTVGVLAALAAPLAAAGISLFAQSTFDTDYLLVRDDQLAAAIAALTESGHTIRMRPAPGL